MRKKDLLREIERIVKKNNELYYDNVRLSKSIEEKERQIETLKNEISRFGQQGGDAEKANDNEISFVLGENLSDDHPAEDAADGEKLSCRGECELDFSALNKNPDTPEEPDTGLGECQPAELDSAASVIGSVVLKCAELCNGFAERGDGNAKDLINLALGRTEVFKSEVLQIMSGDLSEEQKISDIGEKVKDVEDYFDKLSKQI